jgi:hypothetical protein
MWACRWAQSLPSTREALSTGALQPMRFSSCDRGQPLPSHPGLLVHEGVNSINLEMSNIKLSYIRRRPSSITSNQSMRASPRWMASAPVGRRLHAGKVLARGVGGPRSLSRPRRTGDARSRQLKRPAFGLRQNGAGGATINCVKSEIKLSSPHEQVCLSYGNAASSAGRFECPRGKGREKISSARIPCNPLISLDQDERIQGNPRETNSCQRRVLRRNGSAPRKPKLTG